MTIDKAKLLRPGDKVTHNGAWAYRIGTPTEFEVANADDVCIRVCKAQRYVHRYTWSGCADFVTRDFFASCEVSK
jgi:hypothetical protein